MLSRCSREGIIGKKKCGIVDETDKGKSSRKIDNMQLNHER
jgi:hypothetical protein